MATTVKLRRQTSTSKRKKKEKLEFSWDMVKYDEARAQEFIHYWNNYDWGDRKL